MKDTNEVKEELQRSKKELKTIQREYYALPQRGVITFNGKQLEDKLCSLRGYIKALEWYLELID